MKHNVQKVLRLSTANVPSSETTDFGEHRTTETEYGWILWDCGKNPNGETDPEWLRPILSRARSLGCSMVEFDRDDEPGEGLQAYEW